MKIRLKGFRSLIKAVQNRAHLFPVKKLINGKTKTFYATRYVSGGEAMDIAKQGYKINSYQEAVFESKDGKKKNISEKEVLEMYDAAGKPGILQEFIKQNFKRPKVKANTKDNGQLSFDSMMQGNNKKSKNEEKIDKYLSYYKKENHELDVENLNPIQSGDKQEKEIANKERLSLAFKYNNEIGYMKNNVDSSTNTESLKNDYNRHSKLEEIFNNRNDADYWIGTRDNVHELADLLKYDAEYIKEEQKPNGKGDEPSPYGKLSKYQFRRLQQKGASLWDKNGEKRLYFNDVGLALAEKIGEESNFSDATKKTLNRIASKLFYDIDEGKFYSYFGEVQRGEAKLLFEEANKLLEQLKQEEANDPKDVSRLSDNPNLTASQEQALLERLGINADTEDIYASTRVKPDIRVIEELIGKKYSKIGEESYSKAATNRINETLYNLRYDVNKNEVIGDTKDREGIRGMVQSAINNLIEEIKTETQGNEPDLNALAEQNQALEDKRAKQRLREYSKEYVEEYEERNTLDDLNARDRFGTKKIESKGEYKQVSNINELIDKARAIKDYHVDVKGRAILDMLGVNIPMYAKRNGKLFAGKNLGYCRAIVNEETGQVMPYEIGIVAETSNKTRETGTVIHEAMHAKIKGISDNMLNKCAIKGGLSEAEVQHNVEESLVEMAGFSLAKTIHAGDNYRGYMTYPTEISLTLPRIWDIEEFKEARKKGIDGIGKEIYNQIMAGNREFIDKIVNTYVSDEAKEKASKRTAAIEKTMLDRTDKLETITGGNEKSPIGNLVEELKRGTISLEVALNSSKYGAIAAVLITKFLEDEDLDGIDALIGSL